MNFQSMMYTYYEIIFTLCISRQIHGNLGSSVAEGSEVIEPEEWHHLVYRYDAQSKNNVCLKERLSDGRGKEGGLTNRRQKKKN